MKYLNRDMTKYIKYERPTNNVKRNLRTYIVLTK